MKKLLVAALAPMLALAACNQQPYAYQQPAVVVQQPNTGALMTGVVGGMIIHHALVQPHYGYYNRPYYGHPYYGGTTIVHHYGSYGGGYRPRTTVHVFHH